MGYHVTDDEAFIRRIVDSPGDDTPRLVYADWLDERDDPRGAYLRAEVEWAKPWRSNDRPYNDPNLWELSTRLDPVWVCRVSRPPVGVCCDHLQFTNSGPTVGPWDIAACEADYMAGEPIPGVRPSTPFRGFPAAYRAFVLNQNGGEYPSCSFMVPEVEGAEPYIAQVGHRYYRLGEKAPYRSSTWPGETWILLACTPNDEAPWPWDEPDNFLAVRLDGTVAGQVYFASRFRHAWSPGRFPRVASSLPEFFSLLSPDREPSPVAHKIAL
jgi:uncharacterized protein (TIGR02996 family)